MKRKLPGFTLIELLLVVVIIALLISLVLPTGGVVFRILDENRCVTNLKGLAQAFKGYADEWGTYPPLVATNEYWADYGGMYRNSIIHPQNNHLVLNVGRFDAGFGPLVWHRLINTDTLICPRDRERLGVDWWTTTNPEPLEVKQAIESGSTARPTSVASYSIRAYMYPWSHSRLETRFDVRLDNATVYNTSMQAFMACRISTAADVPLRHERGAPVAYLDGSNTFRTDRVLWDDSLNKMTDNFRSPTNQKQMMAIWQQLDQRD